MIKGSQIKFDADLKLSLKAKFLGAIYKKIIQTISNRNYLIKLMNRDHEPIEL